MKNKKRTLYLLIAVIAIYVAIIVRFFMLSNDSNSTGTTDFLATDFKPTTYEVRKDFTINNNYRDPFLGKLPKSNKRAPKARRSQPSTTNTFFPDVQYVGVISDTKSGTKVLSLKVNGNEYVVREGKTVDSVKVLSGNSNNIVVSYKGKRKTIRISGQ